MSTRPRKAPARGRPRGARSFDSRVAGAFGDIVRQTRTAAGVSQEDLAHLAQIERSYFGRIERGQSQPTLFVLLKIAAALGFEGATLVGLVEESLAKREVAR